MKSLLVKHHGPSILHCQYHVSWWPGDASSQAISSYDIGILNRNILISTRMVEINQRWFSHSHPPATKIPFLVIRYTHFESDPNLLVRCYHGTIRTCAQLPEVNKRCHWPTTWLGANGREAPRVIFSTAFIYTVSAEWCYQGAADIKNNGVYIRLPYGGIIATHSWMNKTELQISGCKQTKVEIGVVVFVLMSVRIRCKKNLRASVVELLSQCPPTQTITALPVYCVMERHWWSGQRVARPALDPCQP